MWLHVLDSTPFLVKTYAASAAVAPSGSMLSTRLLFVFTQLVSGICGDMSFWWLVLVSRVYSLYMFRISLCTCFAKRFIFYTQNSWIWKQLICQSLSVGRSSASSLVPTHGEHNKKRQV